MSAITQGAEAGAKFVTFEGIDGAGKSTHIGWFAETLREKLNGSARVVLTREPGGTALGESLRDLLLHRTMHFETEALLMFAARREHLAEVIEPALERGDWVLSDRFTDASFAYQGAGRGLAAEKLETLEHWVHPGRQPDVTVLFDLPVEVARARLTNGRVADKFEQHDGPFFQRVRNEYLRRARVSPARFRLIDGSLSVERIRELLRSTIETLIYE